MKNRLKRILAALLCLALLPCMPATGEEDILPVLQLEETGAEPASESPSAPEELQIEAPAAEPATSATPQPTAELAPAATPEPTAELAPAATPEPEATSAPVEEEETALQVVTMQQVASELLEVEGVPSGEAVPQTIEASIDTLTLCVGQTSKALFGVSTDAGNISHIYTYASNDEGVVKVDAVTGELTAIAKGRATITITAGSDPSATAQCEVTVVELAADQLYIGVGDTYDINQLILHPDGAGAGEYTYTSGNLKYATVDAGGVITGLRFGMVYITICTADGLNVNVLVVCWNYATANRMALLPAAQTLGAGGSCQMNPFFTSGYYGLYTLTSSDVNVATVDADGTVHAVGPGEATITMALVKYPSIQKTATITVKGVPQAIEASTDTLTLCAGQTSKALFGVNPDAASTSCAFTYASSDEGVVKVDAVTGELTATGRGKATITITADNNPDATARCEVTVIELAATQLYIGVGDNYDINQLILHSDGAGAGEYTYTSGNLKYATVDAGGVITGQRLGMVYITIRTADGLSANVLVVCWNYATANRMALLPAAQTLGAGGSCQMNPFFTSGYYGLYTLTSSDERVVTVDADGTVHAVGPGEATITMALVKYPSIQKTATITVKGVPQTIEASADTLTLCAGQTSKALFGVNPDAASTSCAFTYASSDEGVVKVDAVTGELTATGRGKATITITADNNPDATARCEVTVIELAATQLYIGVGDTYDINQLILHPDGMGAGEYTYTSGNLKYATVDAGGVITGQRLGMVYITICTADGLSANVLVVCWNYATSSRMALLPATQTLGAGESGQINPYFTSGYYGLYTLASSDERIATVDADGTVHAVGPGEATITMALVKSPAIQKTAKVRVMGVPDAITASTTELTLGLGQVSTALQGVNPNPDYTRCGFIYASSNEGVAQVDPATGAITAVGTGTAVITITADNNPAASAQCAVTVAPAPQAINLDAARTSIGIWEQVRLNYSLLPEGSAAALTFKSSNPAVASISADGVITGKKIGWAVITVSAHNTVQSQLTLLVTYAPSRVNIAADRNMLGVGEELQFTASIPSNTAGGYSFASSDEGVLAIDPATGLARAVGAGSAKVTAIAYNGVKGSFDVAVHPAPQEITLSRETAIIGLGDTLSLTAQLDDGAAGSYRVYSLNPEVASFDERTGLISTHGEGDAAIVAEAYNGVSAQLNLQVTVPPDAIRLTGLLEQDGVYHLELKRGESYTLQMDKGVYSDITLGYTAAGSAVSVDANGKITALAKGSAAVTITSYNGQTAVVQVTVPGFVESLSGAQTIMHAMGAINGKVYSNSREAFLANYARGHRLFEIDLSYTSDGELVLWHSWKSNQINSMCRPGYVPTLKQFENALVFDAYDSLTYRDLLRLMDAYPDAYFFMDTKETVATVVKKQYTQMVAIAREMGLEHVLDRMVVMIYNVAMYPIVSGAYPFKNYVLMCYKLFASTPTPAQVLSAMKYCSLNGIEIISMWDSWWNPAYMTWAEQYGLTVNLHTVNSLDKAQQYLQQGVSLITSDTLDAQIIAP